MEKVEITLYEYRELSEEAKAKVLEKFRGINIDHEWWEFIFEDCIVI